MSYAGFGIMTDNPNFMRDVSATGRNLAMEFGVPFQRIMRQHCIRIHWFVRRGEAWNVKGGQSLRLLKTRLPSPPSLQKKGNTS